MPPHLFSPFLDFLLFFTITTFPRTDFLSGREEQRLARNAYGPSEPHVKLHLFGIPVAFAQAIGLLSVA